MAWQTGSQINDVTFMMDWHIVMTWIFFNDFVLLRASLVPRRRSIEEIHGSTRVVITTLSLATNVVVQLRLS